MSLKSLSRSVATTNLQSTRGVMCHLDNPTIGQKSPENIMIFLDLQQSFNPCCRKRKSQSPPETASRLACVNIKTNTMSLLCDYPRKHSLRQKIDLIAETFQTFIVAAIYGRRQVTKP